MNASNENRKLAANAEAAYKAASLSSPQTKPLLSSVKSSLQVRSPVHNITPSRECTGGSGISLSPVPPSPPPPAAHLACRMEAMALLNSLSMLRQL